MDKRRLSRWAALCLTAVVAFPASAWGPKTQASIVLGSGHMFSQNAKISKSKFQDSLKMGVRISPEEEAQLYPDFDSTPVISIQREIYLLQSMRGQRIDGYYAYRMGALGKKVVELSAPMRKAPRETREAYYSDVDKNIARANLIPEKVKVIEPSEYFSIITQAASENDRIINFDYNSDIKMSGVASKALHADVSRAFSAVSNVWHTIFNSSVSGSNSSKSDMRDFMLGAIDFFLKEKDIKSVNSVYKEAQAKKILTPEVEKIVGDLYFNNEYYEEALRIYHSLLSANPGQRDIAERIAQYHILVGDKALKAENLEEARDAYQQAVQANAFAEEASRKLTEMNITIDKRDNRNMTQGDLNTKALQLVDKAEQSGRSRDYAGAIQYLNEAFSAYSGITDEFPTLSKQKTMGMRTVKIKLTEMKKSLVENAQRLSGSGFAYDAKRLAAMTEDTAPNTLQSIIQQEYEAAVSDIARDIDSQ